MLSNQLYCLLYSRHLKNQLSFEEAINFINYIIKNKINKNCSIEFYFLSELNAHSKKKIDLINLFKADKEKQELLKAIDIQTTTTTKRKNKI